jgi:hypothetical protein
LGSIEQNDPVPLLPSRSDFETPENNEYIGPRPKTGDKRKEAELDDEYLLQLQVCGREKGREEYRTRRRKRKGETTDTLVCA